jgi:hypothetical protein
VSVGQGELQSRAGSQFLQVHRANVQAQSIVDYLKI